MSSPFSLANESEVRAAFWAEHPELAARAARRLGRDPEDVRQNDHDTDTRCAFVDWLDGAARDGRVSEELAQEVTL